MKRFVTAIAVSLAYLTLITGCAPTEEIDVSRAMRAAGLPEQVAPQDVEAHPGDASACEITMDAYNRFIVALNKYTTAKTDKPYWNITAQSRFRDQKAEVAEALEQAQNTDLIDRLTTLEKQARGQSDTDFAGYPQNMFFLEDICQDLGAEVERLEMERPD